MGRYFFLAILAALLSIPSNGIAARDNYMLVNGKCAQLVLGENEYSDQCTKHLFHVATSAERIIFQFFAENAPVASVSFVGADGENPSADTDITHIHTVIVTTNGQDRQYTAKGLCSYGNPYKGRTTVSCSGSSNELGRFDASFFTDGSAPDTLSPRGSAKSQPDTDVGKDSSRGKVEKDASRGGGPSTASASLLRDCQTNFPGVAFTSLASAFAKEGKFFFHLGDGRQFYIEETEVGDGEGFSIRVALSHRSANLLLDQAGNLYGPFIMGTAGRYADEETHQSAACTILYRSSQPTSFGEIEERLEAVQQDGSQDSDVEQGYSTEEENTKIVTEWGGDFYLKVCNKTKRDVLLAFYMKYNNLVVDESYVVAGWYTAKKGDCTDLGKFPMGDFAFYANDDQGRRWEGKDKRLCVESSRFKRIYYDDYQCSKSQVRGFSRINVTSDTYTINLNK